MTNVEEPPSKRQKHSDDEETLRALLIEEIDHEIALRTRLQETVQSRLTWALILQETLERQVSLTKAEDDPGPSSSEFLNSALDAYNATREPSAFLLLEDTSPPASLLERIASAQATAEPSPTVSQLPGRPRHLPRQNALLHHDDRRGNEPNKYLYIRDIQSTPATLYKLACPDCDRSDFPRLQGLLNHCRLKHKREFGSHDECIQHCAGIVPEEEQALVIERGLEVTGMSASLRRLFEMAVGANAGGVFGLLEQPGVYDTQAATYGSDDEERKDVEEATLVTKTLGHHKDSPALAPFLGRAPKKKQIHVYDESSPVDIIGFDERENRTRKWTMQYQERSGVTLADGEDESVEEASVTTEVKAQLHLSALQGGSRFHISARLAISDWSLRLSEGETKKEPYLQNATHRWMIQIKAPSYSLHESIILKKATITPISEPAPRSFKASTTVSDPPFCVMGLSDRPFLARITLEWAGTQNNPTHVEHWVDLDIGRSAKPLIGDEQFIDVELDRNTELLPKREDAWTIDWRSEAERKRAARKDGLIGTGSSIKTNDLPHIARLKTLLQRFPMTARDAGLRVVPRTLPYFLPLSVKQFNEMVPGRQKAIEWGRARALWESYSRTEQNLVRSSSAQAVQGLEATLGETPQGENHERFSGAMDVYRWLETEGHFPRSLPSRSDAIKSKSLNISADAVVNTTAHSSTREDNIQFCAFCGLSTRAHARFHGQQKEKEKDGGDPVNSRLCPMPEWASKTPLLDADSVRSHIYQRFDQAVQPAKTGDVDMGAPPAAMSKNMALQKEVLRAEEPLMIYAVQKIAASLRLPAVDPSQSVSIGPDNIREAGDVERVLAPYAILAIATRVFVRKLVHGGLQVMETRSSNATSLSTSLTKDGSGFAHGPRTGARVAGARGSAGGRRQILTPAHIIRGLVNGAPMSKVSTGLLGNSNAAGGSPSSCAIAMLIGLSRLGIEVPETRAALSSDTNSAATVTEANVTGDQAANRG